MTPKPGASKILFAGATPSQILTWGRGALFGGVPNVQCPQVVAVLGMQICLKYPHICIQMGVVEEGGGVVGSTHRAEHPEKEATHPE